MASKGHPIQQQQQQRQGKCSPKLGHVSSTWLNNYGALVDYSDTAPAPSKDFYRVFITPEHFDKKNNKHNQGEFCLQYWKIVPPTRADSRNPPMEYRENFEDFLHDERCQSELQRLVGRNTCEYLMNMIQFGQIDYLDRLPDKLLIEIILDLDLEDIYRLGRVNKRFRLLCNSCELWERIYRKYSETPITPELEILAAERGWKKLFFTNKLQLQMQLSRIKKHEGGSGYAFMTEQEDMQD